MRVPGSAAHDPYLDTWIRLLNRQRYLVSRYLANRLLVLPDEPVPGSPDEPCVALAAGAPSRLIPKYVETSLVLRHN